MDFLKFANEVNLYQKTEIEKVRCTAFYLNISNNSISFSLTQITDLLNDIGHPISNISRLKTNIIKSKDFKKYGKTNEYILTPTIKQALNQEYSSLIDDTERIISSSEILDEALFLGHRRYLDKLIQQINGCYANHFYDACAVLMRRTFEVLLILAFENNNLGTEIKDQNGDYVMLEKIVTKAMQNNPLQLSRSRKEYNDIRNLGNFAAHKIHFNTVKKDIDDLKQTYRVCLEELLYKAGLKN